MNIANPDPRLVTAKQRFDINSAADFLCQVASEFTPEGSSPLAVARQWLYALAYDRALYAENNDVEDCLGGTIKREQVESTLRERFYDYSPNLARTLIQVQTSVPPSIHNQFSFIDLFAGIGGMRIGFERAGGTCVFSSEFDAKAQKTYEANYWETPFGDITRIPPELIPDHDVLLAGFPCQPFSHAGLKLGIEDTRGTLFYNIASILERKRPKFAFLENVKGLVSHQGGETLKIVLNTLIMLGYRCTIPNDVIANGATSEIQKFAKQMVLRSVDFGVPQNRQRIYIVLWRDDLEDLFRYPEPVNIETRVSDILDSVPDSCLTISNRLWSGHQRRKQENKRKGKGFGYGLVYPDSQYTNTISARYYKDGSEILIAQKNANPRKLSPREAARLQGFPESFVINESSVQAYKQFGNSVSIPVIEACAIEIKSCLDKGVANDRTT